MLQLLELIAAGASLHDALHAIVVRFERLHAGSICSVLMARDGALYTAAAPGLPDDFNAAVAGLPIAEGSAVCGTAAARRAAVFIEDLATDPLTAAFHELAERHQLKSTWSTPVLTEAGDVIATFAIYRRDSLPPTRAQQDDVADAARLVRIVVEREEALAQRRSSEALLQLAGQVAHLGAWAVELPSRRVTWSEECARIHKMPHSHRPSFEESIDFYAPERRAEITAAVERCASDGTPVDVETELLLRDGSRVHVRVSGRAIRDRFDRITSLQGSIQDITERVEAERERRSLAEKLQRTLQSITDGVIILDRQWVIQFANDEACRLVRLSSDALVGHVFWDVFREAVGTHFEREYRRAVDTGETVRVEDYYGPLEGWFEVHASPSTEGLSLYFRNSTERHESLARIAEQAALLDIARDAVLVRRLDDRIVYWNRGAERLYGWSAEEAIGQNARDLINARSVEFDGAKRALLEQGEWSGILPQVTRAGARLVVEGRWTLMRDAAGQPSSILAINTDITERRSLEQQFLRAQRLESIGTLAGGIAHDLNNVLAPIMMSLDLLRDLTPASGAALLEDLQGNVRRGAELVRQVLTFARGLDGKREPVDVALILKELERVIRDTFPKTITLSGIAPNRSAMAMGDATQIHQVLMNLCVNARDAMPDGGTLTLRIEPRHFGDERAADAAGVSVGRYVAVSVADTGVGIPLGSQNMIFEPFYTTKDVGRGTGLGLSTVASIVKSHGGSVQLQSEPGRGATFTVLLPSASAESTTEEPSARLRAPVGLGQVILVVDDEPLIRSVAERVLTHGGYRVVLAENGVVALERLRERPDIAAMICDLSMPVMDGPATIAAVRQLRPTLPIIVSSGYFGDDGAGKLLQTGVEHFVSKPFTSRTLLAALHGLIGGS